MKAHQEAYSVLVFDMARTGEPDGERRVDGFATFEAARAYAEARMRASIEDLRTENQTAAELSHLWHIYGEDCIVMGGGYSGRDHLAGYIELRASAEECDWPALAPTRPGLLRQRRFHVTVMVPAQELSGLDKFVWAGGFLTRAEKPTRPELLDIYGADAKAAFARKGHAEVTLDPVNVVHVFELPDLPQPPIDGRALRNWEIAFDFVCHDIKFGSTARGVFAWPEKPEGEALRQMQTVLMADSLAIRGDGPDWVDMCEADEPGISETRDPPSHG